VTDAWSFQGRHGVTVDWSSLPLVRELVDVAHSGFVCVNADGRVVYLNPRAQEMFGRAVESPAGIELSELLGPASYEAAQKRLGRLRAGEEPDPPVWDAELSARGADGREFPVNLTVSPRLSRLWL